MGKIDATVTIPAPKEQVFDAIVTPASYDHWMTTHTKWKGDVPERFSQGVTYAEVVTMLGMANTITWTVSELTDTSLTINGTGMAGVTSTFTMSVADAPEGGTTASISAEFEGQMVVGALGKAVEKDAQANLDASLAKLTDYVSAGAPA